MTRTDFEFSALGVGSAAYLGVAVTVQYLQPIFGIAAGALLLGDHLGLAFLVGSLLVLAGLSITLSRR